MMFLSLMQVAVIIDKGFEQNCHAYLSTFMDIAWAKQGIVYGTTQDPYKLLYMNQVANRILFDAQCTPEIPQSWPKEKSFRVTAHGYLDNMEQAAQFGALIHKATQAPVNLSKPDLQVHCYATTDGIIWGIDPAPKELYKREYRIYTQSSMMRSTFGIQLLLCAGYTAKKTLLDPFCGSGTIPIEAALYASKRSPHYYRKQDFGVDVSEYDKTITDQKLPIFGYDYLLKRVRATNHNAKIAGVLNNIQTSRVDIDWIDTKHEQVDCIVTDPPHFSATKSVHKLYHRLFEQAISLLSKQGCLVLAVEDKLNIELPPELKITHSFIGHMGQQAYFVLKIQKH
ncbi:MAG: methyltransferase [Candidatus Woesearchaeota archaeon]